MPHGSDELVVRWSVCVVVCMAHGGQFAVSRGCQIDGFCRVRGR